MLFFCLKYVIKLGKKFIINKLFVNVLVKWKLDSLVCFRLLLVIIFIKVE